MKAHKDLDVWKKAISLAKSIYDLTKYFPKEETYGLQSPITNHEEMKAKNATGKGKNCEYECLS